MSDSEWPREEFDQALEIGAHFARTPGGQPRLFINDLNNKVELPLDTIALIAEWAELMLRIHPEIRNAEREAAARLTATDAQKALNAVSGRCAISGL